MSVAKFPLESEPPIFLSFPLTRRKTSLQSCFLLHFLSFLLLFSWIYSPYDQLWKVLDRQVFYFLNQWMQERTPWSTLWVIANHRLFDWWTDFIVFSLLTCSLLNTPKGFRLKKGCFFLSALLFILLIMMFNNSLFHRLFQVTRESPSLVLQPFYSAQELFPNWKVKESSPISFPSGHGTTLWLAASLFSLGLEKRKAWILILYLSFCSLPRLVVGAHWASDLLVGSGSIVCLAVAWFRFTPLGEKMTGGFYLFFCKVMRL